MRAHIFTAFAGLSIYMMSCTAQNQVSFIDSGLTESFIPRAFADFDRDGNLDIWVSRPELPDSVALGDGHLGFKISPQPVANYRANQVITSDIDKDGDMDILTLDREKVLHVLVNDGAGLFEESFDTDFGMSISSIAMDDLDGDGYPDVWVVRYNGSEIWFNHKDSTFRRPDQPFAMEEETTRSVELGDVDGDSDLDAWVGSGRHTRVWFNNGQGFFTPSEQSFPASQNIVLGDVNNDSHLDALLTRRTRGDQQSLLIYLNSGHGTFAPSNSLPPRTVLMGLALLDAENDGDLDIWLGSGSLLLNSGKGVFNALSIVGIEGDSSLVHAIDVDGDDDLDIWVSKNSRLWLNGEAPEIRSIKRVHDSVTISYSGILQFARSPNGPFSDIADAGKPHTQSTSVTSMYFRSRSSEAF